MPAMPSEKSVDSTVAFLLDPYHFISKGCQRHNSNVFEARLLLKKTLCMRGPEMSALFYDESRFIRSGATPLRLQKTLFGQGGVQGLDDAAHKHRKRMFMDVLTEAAVARLGAISTQWWQRYAKNWEASQEPVTLFKQVKQLLLQSVCEWAGMPLPEEDVAWRARQVSALFEYAGAVGPPHWFARLARKQTEAWLAALISEVREGKSQSPEGSALHAVATYRDEEGELLPLPIAAVELLNLIRPVVAVSVYIVFIAHALHTNPPTLRQKLIEAPEPDRQYFIQEVRRFYPFFPAVAAVVRETFLWEGHCFVEGQHALLDLYGTNHDPQAWQEPDRFNPERFSGWQEDPYAFIPQGGGHPLTQHRCPGEATTITLMRAALDFLLERIEYAVPGQDLRLAFPRLPALPRSHFIIEQVRCL